VSKTIFHRRKLVLFTSVILILALLIVGYSIVIRSAESTLQLLVESESGGKLKFQAERVTLDLPHLRFKFRNPELWTHDTTSAETGYHIKAQSLSIKVHNLRALFTKNQIMVDSVAVLSPEIEVNRYHMGDKVKVSLPEEMNIIYLSLRKVLTFVNLDYLHIDAAKLVINDFTKPGSLPIVLSKLNLVVEKVNDDVGAGDQRFLLADRIMFEVFDQDITSSNGLNRLKFKKLRLSTLSRTIKLDSCFISGKSADNSGAGFNSFVDTLRVTNVDFNALVKDGKIKLDSALCINPELNFLIQLKGERKSKKTLEEVVESSDSLDVMLKKMLGDLDIGYLEVKNAKVKIIAQKGDKSKVFQTDKSNFRLKGFLVSSDPAVPIQLERFNLQLMNYKGYSPDSLYVVEFDEIQVLNKGISLLNFRVGPTRENNELLSREIKMAAFEFNDIDWPKLLYDSRIVARSAVLVKPELHLKMAEIKKRAVGTGSKPMDLLNELRNKIQVDGLFVRDGAMTLDIGDDKHIAIEQLNAGVGVNELLKVENSFRLIDAFDTLSFSKGDFISPELSLLLTNGSFSSRDKSLKFSQIIQGTSDKSLAIKLQDLTLEGFYFNSQDSILIKKMSWGTADILVNSLLKSDTLNPSKPISRIISISSLSGSSTNLDIRGKNLDATARLNLIKTDQMVLASGQNPKISGLFVDGRYVHLKKGELRGEVAAFILRDQGSSALNGLVINLPVREETTFIHIPQVRFTADLSRIVAGDLSIGSMELQQPVVSFLPRSAGTLQQEKRSGFKIPKLSIGRLKMSQPSLIGLPQAMSEKMQLNTGRSDWNFVGIHSDTASLTIDSLRFATSRPFFSNPKLKLVPTGMETLAINASEIHFQPGAGTRKSSWSVVLDEVKTSGFDLNLLNGDTVKQHIVLKSLNLSNLRLNDATAVNIPELVKSNRYFSIDKGNVLLKNDKIRLEALNFSFDQLHRSISLDSLSFRPLADREAFMKGREYRQGYMLVNTGLVQVKNIDFDQLLHDSLFHSGNIVVNNLKFVNYIDKRLPFQHGIEKPMLTGLFAKLKTKFVVDTLVLRNSEIVAEEINDKTLLPGSVNLTQIKGAITGIRNCNYSENDYLRFNLFARFMDATDLRINYQQSYMDTLSTFNLKAIASSFDLTALNPMLMPLASAKVKSGHLDTLRMSVVGRKYVAFGVMKMHYHNLNVQYLNQGSEDKPTTKTRFVTFFANSIVRRQRILGSGEVYAERDPEKGFVNYWVKIFIGGVLTNTGVKSDKKQEKKYESSIKKYQVPPIPNIPVDY